ASAGGNRHRPGEQPRRSGRPAWPEPDYLPRAATAHREQLPAGRSDPLTGWLDRLCPAQLTLRSDEPPSWPGDPLDGLAASHTLATAALTGGRDPGADSDRDRPGGTTDAVARHEPDDIERPRSTDHGRRQDAVGAGGSARDEPGSGALRRWGVDRDRR